MIHALIFDFDGLVLETEGPIFQSWQELYQEFGCELSLEDWADILGTMEGSFDPYIDLARKSGRSLDGDPRIQRRQERETSLILSQKALPGVEDILQNARRLGLKTGMASSSDRSWVVGHLARLDLLHYFDVIKTSDDVRLTKPDPELYQAVLKELGIRPEEAIVFEDSPNGILAARRAGIYCVVIPNAITSQLPIDHADLQLESLAEIKLEDLIAQVERHHEQKETMQNALGSRSLPPV